jgi:hypothetical protein
MSVHNDPLNGSTGSRSADGPDPELADLPPPRRPFRRLTLATLTATAIASAAMIVGLIDDVAYAFGGRKPSEVGALASLQLQAKQRNSWVRGDGELERIGGIRFERPLESDSFRLAPLQGNPRVWIQIRVPEGYENEYFVAPTTFSGRLVPQSALGIRYSTLAIAPQAAGWKSGHLPQDAWLLIDGETPASTRWVLGLVALFGTFGLFSIWALASLLRPAAGRPGWLSQQAIET